MKVTVSKLITFAVAFGKVASASPRRGLRKYFPKDETTDEDDEMVQLYIMIGLGAFLLLALICIICRCVRRKRESDELAASA